MGWGLIHAWDRVKPKAPVSRWEVRAGLIEHMHDVRAWRRVA